VYQELLTGTYPYPGKAPAQIMFQHVTAAPDLSGLPDYDRGPIGRALEKNPADRFPSCLVFVQALMTTGPRPGADTRPQSDTATDLMLRSRVDRSVADLSGSAVQTAPPGRDTQRLSGSQRVPAPNDPQTPTVRGANP